MQSRSVLTLAVLIFLSLFPAVAAPAASNAEYAKHFAALSGLSVDVAKAMPADQYGFRPHPESMDFGQLLSHIATANYQFCAGLKDSVPPALPSPTEKDAVVKFLGDSFEAAVISNLTEAQLDAVHNSPDGRLPGREALLALYVHVAHHRSQAKIYLRDEGIRPPPIVSERVSPRFHD